MVTKLNVFLVFLVSLLAGSVLFAENWPQFRGPNAQGTSSAVNLPTEWSKDNNIAWKTAIPGDGWSSPIVWGERVFLTAATNDNKECRVYALDLATGKILWDKHVFDQVPLQRHPKNSYATPTPVTDGETVYAVFSDGSFVALDFEGNVKWTNRELNYFSHHGLGASPILYKNLLIFPVNPSNRGEPKELGWLQPWDKSFLLALDKTTGQERWKGKRGMSRISHASAVVVQVEGKDQILSAAGDVIQGFDPANGELIWTVRSHGEPCVPTPAVGDGLIYSAPTGGDPIRAVRIDGKGDCTDTHLAWEQRRNSSTVPSFLYVKPCLYTVTDNGTLSCLDAATGEFLWQQRIGGTVSASPLYADGKIYVLSEQGETTVLKLSDNPKNAAEVLAKNNLEEDAQASIAVAGNRLLIRTTRHLWCIGK